MTSNRKEIGAFVIICESEELVLRYGKLVGINYLTSPTKVSVFQYLHRARKWILRYDLGLQRTLVYQPRTLNIITLSDYQILYQRICQKLRTLM